MAFKRLFSAFALLLVLSGPALAADAAWVPYESPDFGVRVEFPSPPVSETIRKVISQGPITRTTAQAEVGDGLLLLWMTRYENGEVDAQVTLKAAADSISVNLGGPEISRSPLTVDGAPAMDVYAGPSADGLYVRERLIVRGDRLYQLLAIAPGAAPAETQRFQGSFAFLPAN